MSRHLAVFWLVSILSVNAWATDDKQPDTLTTQPHRWLDRDRFPIRARSFFMVTDNAGDLSDAYAWGIGVGLGYQTPRLVNHLRLGGTAFFSKNLASSDLAARDQQTNQPNRYEIGLFDVQNPGSRAVLVRPEELYAQYLFGKKSWITLGRQLPRSPLINPQDGRLSPTFVEGIVLEWNERANTQIHAEYLTRIAPRSTVGWYNIGESIGLYPVGVDATGKASQYAGNIYSAGVGQLGITQKVGNLVLQFWDTHVQNLFNVAYIRADMGLSMGKKRQLVAGLQSARQWTVGDGGNAESSKAYDQPGNRALFFSGRVGYQTTRWTTYLNATRITAEGRYLMPREWGRDPFYTFMMREKNEGVGDITAINTNLFFTSTGRIRAEASFGYYQLPDVKNVALNKYGMPSYTQTNLSFIYRTGNFPNGWDVQVLWVLKTNVGDTYDNNRYVFNRVGMHQINLILNYHL
ncbi:OprD family outer membrane porin [Spirosoma sp.]|uniref:OprD family outer membrane porin n=1 Tax=Spirosoma sp. TaxID=1899569 RepID=UPI00260CE378|nr:OprD family outer membrane porin [Spirosoma sp.]MCX6216791.1 OprD family outer membrane porin [Spirosoma sp.]